MGATNFGHLVNRNGMGNNVQTTNEAIVDVYSHLDNLLRMTPNTWDQSTNQSWESLRRLALRLNGYPQVENLVQNIMQGTVDSLNDRIDSVGDEAVIESLRSAISDLANHVNQAYGDLHRDFIRQAESTSAALRTTTELSRMYTTLAELYRDDHNRLLDNSTHIRATQEQIKRLNAQRSNTNGSWRHASSAHTRITALRRELNLPAVPRRVYGPDPSTASGSGLGNQRANIRSGWRTVQRGCGHFHKSTTCYHSLQCSCHTCRRNRRARKLSRKAYRKSTYTPEGDPLEDVFRLFDPLIDDFNTPQGF